ncbi:MAG: hypothetical protein WA484_12930 [Solirubrobacteraceae bacterium]
MPRPRCGGCSLFVLAKCIPAEAIGTLAGRQRLEEVPDHRCSLIISFALKIGGGASAYQSLRERRGLRAQVVALLAQLMDPVLHRIDITLDERANCRYLVLQGAKVLLEPRDGAGAGLRLALAQPVSGLDCRPIDEPTKASSPRNALAGELAASEHGAHRHLAQFKAISGLARRETIWHT